MPYLFTPPTQQVAVESRHPFWRRDTDTVGRSVLKMAEAQYLLVDDPSNEQVAASLVAYLGGRTYAISANEAASLRAAGFGTWVANLDNVFPGLDVFPSPSLYTNGVSA